MIGRGMPRRGRFATAALGAAAVLAVALACEAAPPTEPMSEGRGEPVVYIDGVRPENPTAPLIQELDDGEGLPTRLRVREHAEGEPIVYVDGVRLEGRAAMTDLNPDAIGRIEIIKGGAAERLFGSDAAAGVIQIFLKEGVAPRRPVPK